MNTEMVAKLRPEQLKRLDDILRDYPDSSKPLMTGLKTTTAYLGIQITETEVKTVILTLNHLPPIPEDPTAYSIHLQALTIPMRPQSMSEMQANQKEVSSISISKDGKVLKYNNGKGQTPHAAIEEYIDQLQLHCKKGLRDTYFEAVVGPLRAINSIGIFR